MGVKAERQVGLLCQAREFELYPENIESLRRHHLDQGFREKLCMFIGHS